MFKRAVFFSFATVLIVLVNITELSSKQLGVLSKIDLALVKADYKAAFVQLKNKKDKESLYQLAKIYLYHYSAIGMGVDVAKKEAGIILKKAIAKGHKNALFEYTINFYQGKESGKQIEAAAKKGSTLAAKYIGASYYFGKRGKKKDYKKAKFYYMAAAQKGDAKALYHLGLMYNFGYGVKKDKRKAIQWYRKSLAKGYYNAYLQLGRLYSLNREIEPKSIIEKISIRMYQKKYAIALPKLEKLADSGNTSAQYILGAFYIADNYKASKCAKAQKYLYMALKGRQPGVKDHLKYIYSKYSVCK